MRVYIHISLARLKANVLKSIAGNCAADRPAQSVPNKNLQPHCSPVPPMGLSTPHQPRQRAGLVAVVVVVVAVVAVTVVDAMRRAAPWRIPRLEPTTWKATDRTQQTKLHPSSLHLPKKPQKVRVPTTIQCLASTERRHEQPTNIHCWSSSFVVALARETPTSSIACACERCATEPI